MVRPIKKRLPLATFSVRIHFERRSDDGSDIIPASSSMNVRNNITIDPAELALEAVQWAASNPATTGL
jgi:hypothetical protein